MEALTTTVSPFCAVSVVRTSDLKEKPCCPAISLHPIGNSGRVPNPPCGHFSRLPEVGSSGRLAYELLLLSHHLRSHAQASATSVVSRLALIIGAVDCIDGCLPGGDPLCPGPTARTAFALPQPLPHGLRCFRQLLPSRQGGHPRGALVKIGRFCP